MFSEIKHKEYASIASDKILMNITAYCYLLSCNVIRTVNRLKTPSHSHSKRAFQLQQIFLPMNHAIFCPLGNRGADGVPGAAGDIGPRGISVEGPEGIKGYAGLMGDHGPTGNSHGFFSFRFVDG